MKLTLHGGFGEKGRVAIGVEAGGARLLLDCGVNTSARDEAGRYPLIAPEEAARFDAVIVTHQHEDHVAALGWLIARGFRGRIHMTSEARRSASDIWRAYAEPAHAALAEAAAIETMTSGAPFDIGPFSVRTGRSGHAPGGVWVHVARGDASLLHCGDVVPDSPVFPMDPVPRAAAILIDASYGDDDVAFAERAAAVRAWSDAHPGCVLPTPLEGRSLELMAILAAPFAIAASMRDALAAQIGNEAWLRPSMIPSLAAKLMSARDWRENDPQPPRSLLCDDGMGMTGPSRAILARARAGRWPTLFTGHLPAGSPGFSMRAGGEADWLRLPTHPILSENLALVAKSGARVVLGHSAEAGALAALAAHLPHLRTGARNGDVLWVAE